MKTAPKVLLFFLVLSSSVVLFLYFKNDTSSNTQPQNSEISTKNSEPEAIPLQVETHATPQTQTEAAEQTHTNMLHGLIPTNSPELISEKLTLMAETSRTFLVSDPALWTPEKIQAEFAPFKIELNIEMRGAAGSKRQELTLAKSTTLSDFSSYFWMQDSKRANFSHVRYQMKINSENAKRALKDAEISAREAGWEIDQLKEFKLRALKNGFEMMMYFDTEPSDAQGSEGVAKSTEKLASEGSLGVIFEYQQH